MRHPLHPALVHFPIACWSLATAADVASVWWGEPAWQFSAVLMAIGLVTAIATMAAGLFELMQLDADHPAMADVNRHMLLAMAAWCLYAASLLLRLEGIHPTAPTALDIGLSVTGFIVLGFTGWLGGKLVYGYGVGMEKQDPS